MSEAKVDDLIVKIDDMLNDRSSAMTKPSIFAVESHLRSKNWKAYDPKIIAIGPFHKEKTQVLEMEQHKVRYLKLLLQRRNESSVERYVAEIRSLENDVRQCYPGVIPLSGDQFPEMLLYDGCFIVEFLRKLQHRQYRDKDDPIFLYAHMQNHLMHDLMLFENQIPFLVIQRLCDMSKTDTKDDISSIIQSLLQNGIYRTKDLDQQVVQSEIGSSSDHLLGIVYRIHYSVSFWDKLPQTNNSDVMDINSAKEFKESAISFKKSAVKCLFCIKFTDKLPQTNHSERGANFDVVDINSATEFEELGISFKKSAVKSLFRIEFKDGEIRIPVLEISALTESCLRNLITYENYQTGSSQKYVADYVFFMHYLLRSYKDAKLLIKCGIISNLLENEAKVCNTFQRLAKDIKISDKFSYSGVLRKVNVHRNRKRNRLKAARDRWMARLWRDYFNSPWSLISVLAAVTLLVLTITQTTFAILSFRNDLNTRN